MQDLLTKLPADLHQRARCLLTILLDFCVQVICDPNDEKLLAELPTKYETLIIIDCKSMLVLMLMQLISLH